MFGEKLAVPPIVGKHPQSDAQRAAEVRQILGRLQAGTALTVSGEWEISTLETQRDPKAVFQTAIEYHNLAISRALLVPEKSGFSGGETKAGSYALSQTQFDAYLLVLESLRVRLVRAIQSQLVTEVAEMLAPGEMAPRFKLLPLTQDDKQAIVTAWTGLVSGGCAQATGKDENHVRQLLGFPERDVPAEEMLPGPMGRSDSADGKTPPDGGADDPEPDGAGFAEHARYPKGSHEVTQSGDRAGGKFAPKDAGGSDATAGRPFEKSKERIPDEAKSEAIYGAAANRLREKASEDEQEAIRGYTGGGYSRINEALRDSGGAADEATVRQLDSVTGRRWLADPVTVVRGVRVGLTRTEIAPLDRNVGHAEVIAATKAKAASLFPVGATVNLGPHYQSSSVYIEPALDRTETRAGSLGGTWSAGIIFRVRTRQGAPLHAFSQFDDEGELLLPRNFRGRVRGIGVETFETYASQHERVVVDIEGAE